jgi:hypothetical protein
MLCNVDPNDAAASSRADAAAALRETVDTLDTFDKPSNALAELTDDINNLVYLMQDKTSNEP